jgi:putative transposase
MKQSRFTDSQILAILKQAEGGTPVPELCREHGISSATFYKWRAKYGGLDASLMARLKELEDENRRLKKMVAEERLKAEIIKEALEKRLDAILLTRDGAGKGASKTGQPSPRVCGAQYEPDVLPLCGGERQRLSLESQTGLPHLPQAGAKFTHQAQKAPGP